MSKEILGKVTNFENMPKEKLVEAIKASKDELHSPEQKTTNLTFSILEDNVSEIIEKMESKIPTYVKLYSDLYKKYLHIMNNFCNTCHFTQKEFVDKIVVDDAVITMFDAYLRSIKQMALLQIDLNENMIKNYVGFRLTALDFYDQMINGNINNFAKLFPKFDDFKK
ncbi:MAG: hypothetical protein ACREAR_00360 [Nitrosotalea sp.]